MTSLLDAWVARPRVAALFVAQGGVYDVPGVDLWSVDRDARTYAGPWPVVAHPPCQRWGRFWHGSTRKPHQYELGADDGCFASALSAVRRWGGVLEHPADSHAWAHFGLERPLRSGDWTPAVPAGIDVGSESAALAPAHARAVRIRKSTPHWRRGHDRW